MNFIFECRKFNWRFIIPLWIPVLIVLVGSSFYYKYLCHPSLLLALHCLLQQNVLIKDRKSYHFLWTFDKICFSIPSFRVSITSVYVNPNSCSHICFTFSLYWPSRSYFICSMALKIKLFFPVISSRLSTICWYYAISSG